jgi:hypothetical protein
MKIKTEIIDKVNNVPSRRRISGKLDISDTMLYKHFNENKENGRLTKLDALHAIAAELEVENVMDLVDTEVAA